MVERRRPCPDVFSADGRKSDPGGHRVPDGARKSAIGRVFGFPPLGQLLLAFLSFFPISAQGQTPERVLRIGSFDGPPEYTFGGVADIDVFPDGRILVLDGLEKKLRVYDPSGHHLFSFGQPGEGPGEFLSPVSAVITPGGILVYDSRLRRMVTFDLQGEHVRSESFWKDLGSLKNPTPLRFNKWIASDAGTIPGQVFTGLMSGRTKEEDATRRSVFLMEEPQVDTVFSFRPGWVFWYETTGKGFGPSRRNGSDELIWAVAGDSLVVSVDAVRGDVLWQRVDLGGLVPVAERKLGFTPRERDLGYLDDVARDVKRRHPTFRSIEFIAPEHEPYFKAAVVDSKGGVWLVRTDATEDPVSNGGILLVPMANGGTSELSFPRRASLRAVKDDLLYCVVYDDLDINYVEVYRFAPRKTP